MYNKKKDNMNGKHLLISIFLLASFSNICTSDTEEAETLWDDFYQKQAKPEDFIPSYLIIHTAPSDSGQESHFILSGLLKLLLFIGRRG